MRQKSLVGLYFFILLYMYPLIEFSGLFLCPKIFLIFFEKGGSFLAFNVAVGKCGAKPQRTLTIEYTFIRYVAWAMGEPLSRTKVRQDPPAAYGISGTQGGERPRNRFRNIRLLRIRR